MGFEICPYCDGSGERNFLSGAKCYECNGTGVIEDADPDDCDWDDDNLDATDDSPLTPPPMSGNCAGVPSVESSKRGQQLSHC